MMVFDNNKVLIFPALIILITVLSFSINGTHTAFSISVDNGNSLEEHMKITIGSDGKPIIVYSDNTNSNLVLIHCSTVDCSVRDAPQVLDSYGLGPSIVIGRDTYPVISYSGGSGLQLLHCTTIDCSTHDAPQALDSALVYFPSIAISGDLPFVVYTAYTSGDATWHLFAIHCGNLNCSTHDAPIMLGTDVADFSSVSRGSDFHPVIAYYDYINHLAKVIHCNSFSCSSYSSPQRIDDSSWNGYYTTIATGSDGYPVVSYYDSGLDFVHCTSLDCSSHDGRQKLDSLAYGVNGQISIAKGSDGFPVISYYDVVNHHLKIVHCTQVDCSSKDAPLIVDSGGFNNYVVTTIATGSDSYPVVGYFDYTNGDVKVIHCTNLSCSTHGAPQIVATLSTDVGRYTSITVNSYGWPMITYYDSTKTNLNLLNCFSISCSTYSADTFDSSGDVGQYSSITIGSDNYPVFSYYDATNQALKLIHCTSPHCLQGSDPPLTLDSGGVGQFTSIAKGSDGFPVISYYDSTNRVLKLLHCTSVNCSTKDAPQTVDNGFHVGVYPSIAIGSDGNPVISYWDQSLRHLKAVHCTSVNCSTKDAPQTVDDGYSVGTYTSIAIDTNNLPVISYYDESHGDLKVALCTNISCSKHFVATLDSIGDVGQYSSIAIGSDGRPVISYYDATNKNLNFIQGMTTCVVPPSGTWTISSSCILEISSQVHGDVIVQNNSILTIPGGVQLTIDFVNHHLTVKSGSKVLIKSGGTIT